MLERLKEIGRYRKNRKAEARLKRYYESEQDPEHQYEDIIFDPYPDSIIRSIHDKEVTVFRDRVLDNQEKKV